MKYTEFVAQLRGYAEEEFAEFQRRLIFTEYEILGVRTPKLRELAKAWKKDVQTLLAFPNEYYEAVFVKLTVVASLGYGEFTKTFKRVLPLIDNWALCDSFRPKSLKGKEKEFLPILRGLLNRTGEYERRYALVTLLAYYVKEEYLSEIERALRQVNTEPYYVHMAAAWLVAEVLVKYYDFGVKLLNAGFLDAKTHNKAIAKARESYRVTQEKKANLNAMKIKKDKR
ncbi:MAG: DNA alkylation repair protein [Clostridia bacterium]|nr:DNA alkylation repair protein [Clostridia bacterium]